MDFRRIRVIVTVAIISSGAYTALSQETVLYSFPKFSTEGNFSPESPVVMDSKGNLYGMTDGGGTVNVGSDVFRLSLEPDGTWQEKLLHHFGPGSGAWNLPTGGVTLDSKGSLYGTTIEDGGFFCGTVYELASLPGGSYQEKTIHEFSNEAAEEGCNPRGHLIFDSKGNVYGTTASGGNTSGYCLGDLGAGVVFELSPDGSSGWTEKLLWQFSCGTSDGFDPLSGVIFDPKGNLYGTTNYGGQHGDGAVFELIPQADGSWQEKILHSFSFSVDGRDGSSPEGDLVLDEKGNIFGTTSRGGTEFDGTAFELSPKAGGTWSEKVIYDFGSSHGGDLPDGTFPVAGLVFDKKGNLFGTAPSSTDGRGTVFELHPEANDTWAERVLFSFGTHGRDGLQPEAGLIFDPAGNLYGTTEEGGASNWGTVFEIANPDITAVPKFSISAGTYTATQKVTISDYTQDAKIYYTTNGDEPSAESSDEYSGPIEVKKTETIKAIAVAKDLTDSDLATAKYVIHLPTATPVITPPSATYHALEKVTITDATNEAAIYYTTDGKTPTPISKDFYRGPFRISATTTIKAIAIAPGRSQSKVATDTITIHLPPGSAAEKIQP